jgi:anti-sigma B factor antagonist
MESASNGNGRGGEKASLAVDISSEHKTVVVALSGELDISNVSALQQRLDEALAGHPEKVVFDLAQLRFLDSSGIGLLLGVSARVGSVQLRKPSEIVEQVIRHMGLSEVLSIVP